MTEKVKAPPGLPLTEQGYGGLGLIYVDVYHDHIRVLSISLIHPQTDEAIQIANRRSWAALIQDSKEGTPEIFWERSSVGGNDDFDNPAVNRPEINEIDHTLSDQNRYAKDLSGESINLKRQAFKKIKIAFSNPVTRNAALGQM